jgi:hypothetical protein
MRVLKIVLFTILGLVVVLVLIAGYYGFVPGLSNVLGANKPQDLGIKYTEQDRLNGRAKIGWQVTDLSPGLAPEQSLQYSGQKQVKASFTSQELTAWINKTWPYAILTNAQISVNNDGSVELSGVIHTNRIQTYAQVMGAQSGQVNDFLKKFPSFIKGTPSIYIKASPSVTNNVVSPNIQKLRIGRFNVPSSWISGNEAKIESAVGWQIKAIPGVSISSLSFQNGQAKFEGTLPAVISRSTTK